MTDTRTLGVAKPGPPSLWMTRRNEHAFRLSSLCVADYSLIEKGRQRGDTVICLSFCTNSSSPPASRRGPALHRDRYLVPLDATPVDADEHVVLHLHHLIHVALVGGAARRAYLVVRQVLFLGGGVGRRQKKERRDLQILLTYTIQSFVFLYPRV